MIFGNRDGQISADERLGGSKASGRPPELADNRRMSQTGGPGNGGPKGPQSGDGLPQLWIVS